MANPNILRRHTQVKKSINDLNRHLQSLFFYTYQIKPLLQMFDQITEELKDLSAELSRPINETTALLADQKLFNEIRSELSATTNNKIQFEKLLKTYLVDPVPSHDRIENKILRIAQLAPWELRLLADMDEMATKNPATNIPLAPKRTGLAEELPLEIYRHISRFLTYREISTTLRLVNRSWLAAFSDANLYHKSGYIPFDYVALPRRGVQLRLYKLIREERRRDDDDEEKKDDGHDVNDFRLALSAADLKDDTTTMLIRAEAQALTNRDIQTRISNQRMTQKTIATAALFILALSGIIIYAAKYPNPLLLAGAITSSLCCCACLLECGNDNNDDVFDMQPRLFNDNVQRITRELQQPVVFDAPQKSELRNDEVMIEMRQGVNVNPLTRPPRRAKSPARSPRRFLI